MIANEDQRAFVCVDGKRRVLPGVTVKIGLLPLAELLASDQIFNCKEAMNLSGGPMAGLLVNNSQKAESLGSSSLSLPDAVLVELNDHRSAR
jgi:Na+-translocating ferredoxin:NAD+ oxidoreductase RnfC subunit